MLNKEITRESVLAQSSDVDTVRQFKDGSRERDNIECTWREFVEGHSIPYIMHYGNDYFTDVYDCTYPVRQNRSENEVKEFQSRALVDFFETYNVNGFERRDRLNNLRSIGLATNEDGLDVLFRFESAVKGVLNEWCKNKSRFENDDDVDEIWEEIRERMLVKELNQ